MKLTQEQYEIINSTGDIKINAVAGSGKTTTIIEYARARPVNSKILYIAFNKSVKLQAVKMFADKGLKNVKVETAHSLAYKNIVLKYNYKVRPQGYMTHETAELLGLKGSREKHTEYIVANHINKFISYFCNSDKQKVQDLNYLDVVFDSKAKEFVSRFYEFIESQTRVFLSKMDKGEIEIIHDFYLKKFQLSNPKLNFNYILFDEGQDASQAMLSIFSKQKATKVIVGDSNQQIYGWRFAVNSLDWINYRSYNLSTSFRFGQETAKLAMEILKWKIHLVQHPQIRIKGEGTYKQNRSKAVLARTNLGLFLKAIEYVMEKKKVNRIYFEGNINSYTYAEEGTSLYDILNLYTEKRGLIKDKLIKEMKDIDELEDYIKKTEDVQLSMLVEIVKKYGNEIPGIIKGIKEKHVAKDEKDKAEMIFSTVHRCKGMEYDSIFLVNDFINEEKLESAKTDAQKEGINTAKLNEEINLLYVAVTRSKNFIYIPQSLLPNNFPVFSPIHTITDYESEKDNNKITGSSSKPSHKSIKVDCIIPKVSYYDNIREKHKDAYKPWTKKLDQELTDMYYRGINIKDMAIHFGRTGGAINSRITKLNLKKTYQ